MVIALHINKELQEYVEQGRIQHQSDTISIRHLQDAHMIFGASDDDHINQRVSDWAQQLSIPVNVVDTPELSDFLIGAVVDRSPLTIGICSNGSAPILVRNTRMMLESMLDENLGKLALFADSFRHAVKTKFTISTHRKRFWEEFFNGTIASLFLQGKQNMARKKTLQLLNSTDGTFCHTKKTKFYHISLTQNTADALKIGDIRQLQLADIIVYSPDLNPHIFEYFRRDALRYTEQDYKKIQSTINKDNKICTITCTEIQTGYTIPLVQKVE